MLLITAALVLRLELIRHSLTGTHSRYGQYVDDQRVVGAEVDVTVRPDGRVEESRDVLRGAPAAVSGAPQFIVNIKGVGRYATRVVTGRIARYVDVETGEVIRVEPLFAGAKPARVFDVNPVKKLNDPSLQDQKNSATAVPDAAYSTVDLDDMNPSGPLGGPFVQITDLQPPAVAPADASQSLVFDRSQSGFEDVNAYFHIDRSQRYLQSLGYSGARAIAPYPVPVDTHALNGEDNSLFIPAPEIGQGFLVFGDGGTDDAEDPDLVVHEYAHVIHEWISPGTFLGPFASEARAISEGFADYWGFSASYAQTIRSGRDPFCLADWDARCWQDASSEHCGYPVGADCLRRLDSPKTVADFNSNDASGTEYLNGPIWSSALREIFVAMAQRHGLEAGKRIADTVIVESLFGAPPNPSFAAIARKMIAADRDLNAGSNADVICAAMTHRGILSDCAAVPRGELTLFQSAERGVPIPDNDPAGVTLHAFVSDERTIDRLFVRVDIDHPIRGDLQIVLIAPDGTQFVLQNPSGDRAADIRATFGRDAVPVDSLDALRGRAANGEWRLRVSDLRSRDVGTVLSWSLVIQFTGDVPATSRPSAALRQTIPVVGRIPGANGTFFTTDLRLLNRGSRDVTATLILTPSGVDGRTDFAAVNVDVAAGQVVALSDVVGATFGTGGIGQLEIDGDVIATSRTYTRNASGGTLGELIEPSQGLRLAELIRLYDTDEFRTNIGVAEVSGHGGTVRIALLNPVDRSILATIDHPIAPYGHLQMSATAAPAMIGIVSVIDGGALVAAYASVIDNTTGDATYVAPQSADPAFALAPAISAEGALGTAWTTDLWVAFRGGDACAPEVLTYVAAATLRSSTVTLQCFRELQLPDVVASSFGAAGTAGVISGIVGGENGISEVIGSRGFRQSVSFLAPSAAPSDLAYIENSNAFRTNVGLMSDVASTVRVTLFDAAGREMESSLHTLAPLQLEQFPVRAAVIDGYVHLEVLSGRVAAYASVVDNVTGDASFVPAR